MSLIDITLSTTATLSELAKSGSANASVQRLRNALKKLEYGNLSAATAVFREAEVQATGHLVVATASGTVNAIINGVTIAVAATTSNTTTAASIATAISGSTNSLVANFITVSAAGPTVSITAARGGLMGNAITISASGTGVTTSGARLTGGAETSTTFTF